MPVSHHIEPTEECIYVTLEGAITDDDFIQGQLAIFRDTLFDGRYCRLIDATGVTQFTVGAQAIRRVARVAVEKGVRRIALAAESDLVFAMMRMYEGYAGEAECRVFRDRDQALAWLHRGRGKQGAGVGSASADTRRLRRRPECA